MNRKEALATLGLEDPVSPADIKAAYLESAQILHPDKFAGNHKLQQRATEQFKHMQQAYNYLSTHQIQDFSNDHHASATEAEQSSNSTSSGNTSSDDTSQNSDQTSDETVQARLSGLQAAREQLVAQRDAQIDRRHNAISIMGAGAVVFFLLHRFPFMVALGVTAMIWGIIDFVSARKNIESLDAHIKSLEKQKRKLESLL